MRNVPYPTSLTVGVLVNYKRRQYEVIAENNNLYLIKDVKNGRLRWVRPDNVEIAPVAER